MPSGMISLDWLIGRNKKRPPANRPSEPATKTMNQEVAEKMEGGAGTTDPSLASAVLSDSLTPREEKGFGLPPYSGGGRFSGVYL